MLLVRIRIRTDKAALTAHNIVMDYYENGAGVFLSSLHHHPLL
jgi:hypothetical protein